MDEYRPSGNSGCLLWMVAIIVVVFLLLMAGDGDNNIVKHDTGAPTNNRTGTLSGNQVETLSRNQLNLWSEVQNCFGDYSCMTVISTTTSTVDNTTVDAGTTIDGDRNVVVGSNGDRLCQDPATGIYSPLACEGE